jgi:hypothetical protein
MTNVVERLESYYPFDQDIIDTVAEVAARQQSMTYQEYFDSLFIGKPEMIDGGAQIVDIHPLSDWDGRRARVIHQPMANPLDPNMLYQAATIYASDPTVRTIVTGNPSGIGYGQNLLSRDDREKVMNGNLRPTIDAVSRYLTSTGVESVEHIGYSYGADKAAVAAEFANDYDQEVMTSVHIEPVSVVKRSLAKLGAAFMSTNKELSRYVDASDTPAFKAARKESVGMVTYSLGLARLSNLAIAQALGRDGFEGRMDRALTNQPEMKSSIIWGTDSELAIDGLVSAITGRLIAKYGGERVVPTRLPGQKHALPNDIHLQAALVLRGLGETI